MARMSPEEALRKYQQRASAASSDYKEGVQRVSESPMEKAAESADAWIRSLQESIERYVQGLRSVSLDEWKRQASTKGASNYATGVQNLGSAKKNRMLDNFRLVESIAEQVRTLPRSTFQDRLNRAIEQMRRMHETKQRS